MTETEQVFAQAQVLAGELRETERQRLRLLCQAACAELRRRLRDGLTPADCRADFLAGASLLALSALEETNASGDTVSLGELTFRDGGSHAASRCLRNQAELIMSPYLKPAFSFRGV